MDDITATLREEIGAINRVVDGAIEAPLAHPYALVARMEPADLEPILLAKGPAIETENGEIVVRGKQLAEIFGTPGRGAVKILWRHGEKSPKAGTSEMVTRGDILRTPLIIRDLEPKRSGKGGHRNLKWVVERADGERLAYVAERANQGGNEWEIISIHVLKRTLWNENPPSPWRRGGEAGADQSSPAPGQHRSASDQGRSSAPFGAPEPPSEVLSPIRDTAADVSPSIGRSQDAPATESVAQGAAAIQAPAPGVNRRVAPMLRPPASKPRRLAVWLARNGGLKEDGGELAARDAGRLVPGLVNNKRGMDFDTAALRAWEAGYFVGDERPGVNDFLALLDDDLRTKRVFSAQDDALVTAWDDHDRLWEAVNRAGIEPRGLSDTELLVALHSAARADAEAEFYFGRQGDPSAASGPSPASAVPPDLDAAVVKDARRLLDELGDLDIAVDVVGDGIAVTRSARDWMDEIDGELEAMSHFRSCVLGG